MRKTLQILLMVGLFLASFVLFLFLTFPYEVLKESLAAEISQQTGLGVRIGDMSPALPLGVKAENVKIESANGSAALALSSLKIKVNPFAIVIGKVKASALATAGAGEIEIGADFPILGLVRGTVAPSRLVVDSTAFPLDQAVQFALNSASSSANPMLTPLLTAIGFSGNLNAKVDLSLDAKEPAQSTGQAEIALSKAILKLSHPSLGLPDQAFAKALIKAKVESGNVVLDKASALVSDELEIIPDGKIKIVSKPSPLASQLDLKVAIKLNKGLNEKFGFLMGAFTGKEASDGQITMQLRGPMDQPTTTAF